MSVTEPATLVIVIFTLVDVATNEYQTSSSSAVAPQLFASAEAEAHCTVPGKGTQEDAYTVKGVAVLQSLLTGLDEEHGSVTQIPNVPLLLFPSSQKRI